MTYHRSQNYGAQLQAFALQTYLYSLGYDVCLVDYWPDYHRNMYHPNHFNHQDFLERKMIEKIKYLFRSIILYTHSCLRACHTNQFVDKFLNTSSKNDYDVLIYGSDQIWRKQHIESCPSYNPIYFGDDTFKAGYRIAYAASMGKIEADEQDVSYLKDLLSKFDAISVREIDLKDFIQNKLKLPVSLVSDPVFLLNEEQWQSILPKHQARKSSYILVYDIAHCPNVAKIASLLSKEKQIPIVEFHGYIDKVRFSKNNIDTVGPDVFLHYLRDSSYVVTSSFHGVALSLCLKKQFYFVTIDNLANRTESLLSIIKLNRRNFSAKKTYNFAEFIDYDIISPRIEEYAQSSRQWLLANINKVSL